MVKPEGNHEAYEGKACYLCGHDLLDHIVRPTTKGYRVGCIHQHPEYYTDNCECNAGIKTKGDDGTDSQLEDFINSITTKRKKKR